MTMPQVDDPFIWCVAQALQTCLCAQLEQTSAAAACCCIAPGERVIWDDCTAGQAWVRLVTDYKVGSRFPAAATAAEEVSACGGVGGWAGVFELGVLRCMPGVKQDMALPTCEEITAVTRLVMADKHAMRRAIECCDWRTGCNIDGNQFIVGPYMPSGPEGNCVGGTVTVTVELSGCVCGP